MTNPDLFITLLGAVLLANVLTGAFFWGMMRYTQLEKEGREKSQLGNLPIAAMLLAVVLGGASVIVALG